MKKRKIKIIFRKKFLSELCEDLGHPEEVAKYLKKINNPFLKWILKKNIKQYEAEAAAWAEIEYQHYLEMQDYKNEHQDGCFNCPWGNGEGGCTISGCY